MALDQLGFIFIAHRKQFYSDKVGKVLTIIKLVEVVDNATYKMLHPKSKAKSATVEIDIMESFRESDILLKLAKLYKLAKEQVEEENKYGETDIKHAEVCGRTDKVRKQDEGV
jgi:hypothetical protein